MKHTITTLALLSALCACGKQEPLPPADPMANEETADESLEAPDEEENEAEAAEDEVPSEAELPVAEDFEQEVASAITVDNYEAELEALEKELGEEE